MDILYVELGTQRYPIYIGRNSLSAVGEVWKASDAPSRVVIVTDHNVARLYLHPVANALRHAGFGVERIVIPAGEQQKSLARVSAIISRMIHEGIGKQVAFVALGGGVIGDITGLAAALFRRGVPFVQCPTTLLAQTDSSIGGKVGVNHPLAKNAIGTFYQPKLVYTDIAVLKSLPRREVVSGLGEILKYGIIAGQEMFEFLKAHVNDILTLDMDVIEETVKRCAAVKARLVSEDERETNPHGGRGVLNIGHGVGQMLESLMQYRMRHGEAVLVGLRIETEMAKELGLLTTHDYTMIKQYLGLVDFQFAMGHRHGGAPLFTADKLVRSLLKTRFVLPAGIGKFEFRSGIPEEVIRTAVTGLFKEH